MFLLSILAINLWFHSYTTIWLHKILIHLISRGKWKRDETDPISKIIFCNCFVDFQEHSADAYKILPRNSYFEVFWDCLSRVLSQKATEGGCNSF